MALDTRSLVMQLDPLAKLDYGADRARSRGGNPNAAEQMRLMRDKFEYQKQRDKEAAELARLEEAGRTTRDQMQIEQARYKVEAEQSAKLKQDKQAIYQKFSELNGSGDIEAAQALVPYMTSLGMSVDLEGEVAGLPRYRIAMDAAQAEAEEGADLAESSPYGEDETVEQSASRVNALGLEEGAGPMALPPGIASTGDAFQRALEASEFARATGEAARLPDAPDLTGAVPKNVIDTGAMNQQSLARLNPLLQGAVDAYPDAPGDDPDAYRRSAEQTAAGVRGMGMPATKAAELYRQNRVGPDSLIQAGIAAGAQETRFQRTQGAQEDRTQDALRKTGFSNARVSFTDSGIKTQKEAISAAEEVLELLTNKNPDDDIQVGNLLVKMSGGKGSQSDKDVLRALGMEGSAVIEQAEAWIHKKLSGGFNRTQRQSLIGFANQSQARSEGAIAGWLDSVDETTADMDEVERRGWQQYRDSVIPKKVRDKWSEARKSARAASGTTASAPASSASASPASSEDEAVFQDALTEQAEAAGLDPEKLRGVISKEGGTSNSAKNPNSSATGRIQFMKDTAESLGTSTEALAAMTGAEQVPYIIKYMTRTGKLNDKSTQGDYYMAVAAPGFIGKSDDSVVYKKGSPEWEANSLWRPKGGGDITVGSIKAYGGGGKGSTADTGEKSSSKVARMRELLKKGGY